MIKYISKFNILGICFVYRPYGILFTGHPIPTAQTHKLAEPYFFEKTSSRIKPKKFFVAKKHVN